MRAAIGAAIALFGLVGVAHSNDCSGDIAQEHHPGNFNFLTNSWMEPSGNFYRYVGCVKNLDAVNDLKVDWYIPGPNRSWIPPDEALPNPRLSADGQARPIDGCIEYGNLTDTTVAQFLGDALDEEYSHSARETECKGPVKASNFERPEIQFPSEGWQQEIHTFFPSDLEKEHDTLLELWGKLNIKLIDSEYVIDFSYEAAPYKGRLDGNPNDVLFRPIFPNDRDYFDKAVRSDVGIDAFQKLGPKGSIRYAFSVFFDRWVISPAFFEFSDLGQKPIAYVQFPAFAASSF